MKSSTVSFSVDGRPFAGGVTPESGGEVPPFGPDYAGTFLCRMPTLDEARAAFPLRIAGRAQREGAVDASGAFLTTVYYIAARVWLDGLSESVPGWYEAVQQGTAEDDEKLYEAVLSAQQALMDAIAEKKRARASHSVTPLPSTLRPDATS
jgi:hypothetical protein